MSPPRVATPATASHIPHPGTTEFCEPAQLVLCSLATFIRLAVRRLLQYAKSGGDRDVAFL
jgi:hypothetical protein